jgi:serine/threonine protein phosphatase PrpC
MGGHSGGDLASQLIVNTLKNIPSPEKLSDLVDEVENGIMAANNKLVSISAENNQTMGSTVVSMLARGRYCVCLWAGDSRFYRLRDGRLTQLSTDHSQVNQLLDMGQITAEEAINHPASNMVTRAVGASGDLYIDADIWEMQAGDRYLLCSDGLDKHLADPEIEIMMSKGSPEEVSQILIEITLERGAKDNVTVSVIHISD